MQDLVFVSQRIPYPPNKGDKVRSWNVLSRLAEDYRVHLASFVDDPADWQYEQVLRDICASCLLRPLTPFLAKLRSLPAFVGQDPLTRRYFHDGRIANWLDDLAARRMPDKVFVFSSGVADYVMDPRWAGARRVIDMVDVDSDKWRQYAAAKSGLNRWVYGREARTLADFERRASAVFDATLFVSEAEAELFRTLSPTTAAKVHAVGNGVDCAYFDPAIGFANPYPSGVVPLVFTGAMDYWPNVDAVVWFAEQVLPGLTTRLPNAALFIVGANPDRRVQALDASPVITVTGRVDDIRPYIAHAGVVVAPLQVARGVQNKVLEGMAMAKPVVASPMALEGLDAAPGREVLVAKTPDEYADAVLEITACRHPEIGDLARGRVLGAYSWQASYDKILAILER